VTPLLKAFDAIQKNENAHLRQRKGVCSENAQLINHFNARATMLGPKRVGGESQTRTSADCFVNKYSKKGDLKIIEIITINKKIKKSAPEQNWHSKLKYFIKNDIQQQLYYPH
jgi:hypothetical protein